MNRKRDLEGIGKVYVKNASTEDYYLFLIFRHSRDNAGVNEFRVRKKSELTSRDKSQLGRMKKYTSTVNDRHPDVKTYSMPLGSFPFVICVIGPRDKVTKLLQEYIKNFKGEIYPEKEIMKHKTEDIFGDIIYSESLDEDEYILFIGLLKNSDKSKGVMKKVSNMTGDERKLFTMMTRYDVSPKDRSIKAYELKGSFGPYTLQLAFVGNFDSVKEYAETFKQSYGKNFIFKIVVPVKQETEKHFKNII
jgi:hypothetical protein